MQKTSFKSFISRCKEPFYRRKKITLVEIFSTDALNEMKVFEAQLKKKKRFLKKLMRKLLALLFLFAVRDMPTPRKYCTDKIQLSDQYYFLNYSNVKKFSYWNI